jgi:type IV pilus assembly protein PilB
MQQPRVRLGQLLVDAHIVSTEQLEQVLAFQKSDGRKLGVLLVESGLVTETQLTQVLSQQLSVPWVSLYHIDFSRDLLARVPREVAEKYSLVPIYVRHVRGQGDTLYVAMEDPINEEALTECANSSGLPTRPMIASPTDIRRAIRIYYQGITSVAPSQRVSAMPGEPPAAEPESAPAAEPETLDDDVVKDDVVQIDAEPTSEPAAAATAQERPIAPLPAATDADGAEPEIEAKEAKVPRKRGGFSLTLLDGTTITMPVRSKRRRAQGPASDEITANDVVAALRAASHGADIKDVIGDARWEKLFAALLSLLLRKHLILDGEFIEELKKI